MTTVKSGNYAVMSINKMPWLSEPINQNKGKNRRQKTQPIIQHPIFNECSEYCNELYKDNYWKSIFSQAAYGKYPRGYMFKDGILTFRRGTKTQKIEISSAPIEAMNQCIDFFKKTTGMKSDDDQIEEKKLYDKNTQENDSQLNLTWKEVKTKKKVKKILISLFVSNITKKYQLNDEERKQVSTLINMGIIMGYFSNESIVMELGEIKEISGLIFDEKLRTFSLSNTKPLVKSSNRNKKIISSDEYLDHNYKLDKNNITYIDFMNIWRQIVDSIYKSNNNKIKDTESYENTTEIYTDNGIIEDQSSESIYK